MLKNNLLKRIFSVGKNTSEAESNSSKPIKKLRNWYDERYDSIIIQRNLLFLILITLICLSIILIGVISFVINSKRFDPFVIQIDDKTGIAKTLSPSTSDVLEQNEALAQYFIKKYVVARETYNPVDFDKEAKKIVKLLSSNSVYWNYKGYLKNESVNPILKYGQKNTTFLIVKSWSRIANNKYILRFSLNETAGSRNSFSKIAIVEFQYVPMELTEEQQNINPIGFQVTGYRVDDDSS